MSEEIQLCRLDDVPDGSAVGLLPDGRGKPRLIGIRTGAQVRIYFNLCPHYGKSRLGWKKDEYLNADRSMIMCAAHGALFRPQDGVCVLGPCLGEALQSVRSLVRDGCVYVARADLGVDETRVA